MSADDLPEIPLLRAEVERLRAENRALKERLERPEVLPIAETSIASPEPAPGHARESDVAASVHAGSPPEEKVRLFTQLFGGREDVYAARWAGHLRQVQASKSGLLFAPPAQIPKLMTSLEAGPFRKYTPCRFPSQGEVIEAMAEVHVELVLVHPFRDGNGRPARMLAVVMGLQAGLPPLDFSGVRGRERQIYFDAVRRGLDRDYLPMQQIFERVIAKTLRVYGSRSAFS